MEIAERIQRGQDLVKGSSVNYLEEMEELRHQINMLKLGVNEPEIVEISTAEPVLNRPYNTNNNQSSNNNNRNWNNNRNNNNNNRNWNNNRNNNNNNRNRNNDNNNRNWNSRNNNNQNQGQN